MMKIRKIDKECHEKIGQLEFSYGIFNGTIY